MPFAQLDLHQRIVRAVLRLIIDTIQTRRVHRLEIPVVHLVLRIGREDDTYLFLALRGLHGEDIVLLRLTVHEQLRFGGRHGSEMTVLRLLEHPYPQRSGEVLTGIVVEIKTEGLLEGIGDLLFPKELIIRIGLAPQHRVLIVLWLTTR